MGDFMSGSSKSNGESVIKTRPAVPNLQLPQEYRDVVFTVGTHGVLAGTFCHGKFYCVLNPKANVAFSPDDVRSWAYASDLMALAGHKSE